MYDVDGDGVISRKDLRTTLLLVAGDKLKDDKLDDVRLIIVCCLRSETCAVDHAYLSQARHEMFMSV